MARTMYKIRLNDSVILPDIYFDYREAQQVLESICKRNVATYGTVILYESQDEE